MTTAEKIAFIEAKIREKLPRIKEFREGCILEILGHTYKILHISVNYPDQILLLNLENNGLFSSSFTYPTDGIGSFWDCSYKVIGHEIMLNDVLEWLSLCKKNLYFIDSEGGFGFLDKDGYHRFFHFKFDINLKSPYLRDQSEKMIKFLYNIQNK